MFPPTYRELGAELGLSRASVQRHLEALEAKGYVARGDGSRSLRMLRDYAVVRPRGCAA